MQGFGGFLSGLVKGASSTYGKLDDEKRAQKRQNDMLVASSIDNELKNNMDLTPEDQEQLVRHRLKLVGANPQLIEGVVNASGYHRQALEEAARIESEKASNTTAQVLSDTGLAKPADSGELPGTPAVGGIAPMPAAPRSVREIARARTVRENTEDETRKGELASSLKVKGESQARQAKIDDFTRSNGGVPPNAQQLEKLFGAYVAPTAPKFMPGEMSAEDILQESGQVVPPGQYRKNVSTGEYVPVTDRTRNGSVVWRMGANGQKEFGQQQYDAQGNVTHVNWGIVPNAGLVESTTSGSHDVAVTQANGDVTRERMGTTSTKSPQIGGPNQTGGVTGVAPMPQAPASLSPTGAPPVARPSQKPAGTGAASTPGAPPRGYGSGSVIGHKNPTFVGSQMDDLTASRTLLSLTEDMKRNLGDMQGNLGPIQGRLTGIKWETLGSADLSDKQREFILAMRKLVATEIFDKAGKQLSGNEKSLYIGHLPSINDTPANMLEKIRFEEKYLKNDFASQASFLNPNQRQHLESQGWQFPSIMPGMPAAPAGMGDEVPIGSMIPSGPNKGKYYLGKTADGKFRVSSTPPQGGK